MLLVLLVASGCQAEQSQTMACLLHKLRKGIAGAKAAAVSPCNVTASEPIKAILEAPGARSNLTSDCAEKGLHADKDNRCCQAKDIDVEGTCCMIGTLDKVRPPPPCCL